MGLAISEHGRGINVYLESMSRLGALLVIAIASAGAGAQSIDVRDVDGARHALLAPKPGRLEVVFFISSDCPISNHYIPEIKRICDEYTPRGVGCVTVYPDGAETAASVRTHRREYGVGPAIPAIIDTNQAMVTAIGPKVTPEAAVYASTGRVYRGRIDDLYVDVSRARRQPTSRDLRSALDATLSGKQPAQAETQAVGCFIPQRAS